MGEKKAVTNSLGDEPTESTDDVEVRLDNYVRLLRETRKWISALEREQTLGATVTLADVEPVPGRLLPNRHFSAEPLFLCLSVVL